jgi:hypothetical protein
MVRECHLSWAFRGVVSPTWTSRHHPRRISITEKARLSAALGAFPSGHSLLFLVCLHLEPAVNDGTH